MVIPIYIMIEGRLYPTVDWSFGGFQIKGYHGRLRPGDRFTVSHAGMMIDDLSAMGADCEVVRTAGDTLSAHFNGLSDHVFDLLQAFMMHRPLRQAASRAAY